MARLELTSEVITRSGLKPVETLIPADGIKFLNAGKEIIRLENTDTNSVTITLEIAITIDSQSVTNRTISIPAGESRLVGVFPTTWYNRGGGYVYIDSSVADKVKASVIKVE